MYMSQQYYGPQWGGRGSSFSWTTVILLAYTHSKHLTRSSGLPPHSINRQQSGVSALEVEGRTPAVLGFELPTVFRFWQISFYETATTERVERNNGANRRGNSTLFLNLRGQQTPWIRSDVLPKNAFPLPALLPLQLASMMLRKCMLLSPPVGCHVRRTAAVSVCLSFVFALERFDSCYPYASCEFDRLGTF